MAFQPLNYGFIRVASAVPRVNVADVDFNVSAIISCYNKALNEGAQILVFPELSLTAYSCNDLLASDLLLQQAEWGLDALRIATANSHMLVFVGAPLQHGAQLLNCAVALQHGKILGVVPKSYIPNYSEFYEKRWFSSGCHVPPGSEMCVNGEKVPLGTDLIFDSGSVKIAAELCEDLWVPIPPSSVYALQGANVVVNLSASNELVGKHQELLQIIKHQSRQCNLAYVYASSGYGESTTDIVFAGNAIIADNGEVLQQSNRFSIEEQIVCADIDIEVLEHERRVKSSFADSAFQHFRSMRHVAIELPAVIDFEAATLLRNYNALPFVPVDDAQQAMRLQEIVEIQTEGLMRRLDFTHIGALVIGISGGLDSTLALLVATRAFDRLGFDRKNIYGITMPGFGTTGRTHNNALHMMKALGITVKEISITKAVEQHFKDIEHDINVHDVTYENGQARERTQILMDFANRVNALVLGTGDMSELALGWATYNGDHMSMYNVNGSVTKTLAQHLVKWFAEHSLASREHELRETLLDVVNTPISPELTPATADGQIQQKTEDLIGPYELHEFFLYHMLSYGFGPKKLYRLARQAFAGRYDNASIKKWLTKFIWRFFSQQFKRSCLPDGPKVGKLSLSPRGDWRMPSDASAAMWVKECDELPL